MNEQEKVQGMVGLEGFQEIRGRKELLPVTVDINGLASLLSCGPATAKKLAQEAEARILIGRRVLYSVDKIKKYIDIMSC